MRARSILLLLLACAAVVGAFGWFAMQDGSGDAVERPVTPEGAPANDAADLARPQDALGAAEDEAATRRDQVEGSRSQGGTSISIAVVLPPGTPADEALEVSAVEFTRSRYSSAEEARSGRSRYLASRDTSGMVFGAPRVEPRREGRKLACEPDGRGGFVAHVSADCEAAVIELRARYAFVEAPEIWDPGRASVELRPKLGACLAGRVVLPAALPADLALPSPDKVRAQINGWNLGGGRGNHSTSEPLREDWSFELGGLRPNMNYFLALDAFVLAPASDLEIQLLPGERIVRDYTMLVGARVRGRVTLPDGAPAAQASVRASARGGRLNFTGGRSAETDEHGEFQLDGMTPGDVTLTAQREGFVNSRPLELSLSDLQIASDVELRLGSGAGLSGRVLWPDRTPAAAVQVQVDALGATASTSGNRRPPGRTGRPVQTNADGSFSVEGLDARTFDVTARASTMRGDAPVRWCVKRAGVAPDSEVELVFEEPFEVRGRVEAIAGLPVAKFLVVASAQDGSESIASLDQTFERGDGTFALFLPAGRFSLRATAAGFADSERETLELPPARLDLVLRLSPTSTVSGVVLSPTGAPVEGARVARRGERRGGFFGGDAQSTTSNADGSFALANVAPGAAAIYAQADGFAPSADVELQVEPAAPQSGVELRLRAGGRLEGEIYDSTGQPDPDRQIVVGGFAPGSESGRSTTRSDALGRFVAEHLAPGKYNVLAVPRMNDRRGSDAPRDEAALLSELKMTPVEIFDGQTTHVVLGAPPKSPVRVSGRVTQGGASLTRGTVMVLAEGASMLSSMKASRIDGAGAYSVVLDAPGDCTFVVGERLGDEGSTEFQVRIPEVAEFTLDLEVPGGGIRGRVVGPDGAPAEGVGVALENEGRPSVFVLDASRQVRSDAQGRFELRNLRAGSYTLRAGAGGPGNSAPSRFAASVRSGLAVEEGRWLEGVELRLESACSIAGVVRGSDGATVADAAIFVRDATGRVLNPVSSCNSDSQGRFEFTQAPPGLVTLSARKAGLASRESAPVRAASDAKATVELALESGTMLLATVEDGEGRTLSASLRVLDEAGRDHASLMGSDAWQRMFSEGFSSTERRIGPLPPGKYRVIATLTDGRSESKPLTLAGQSERSMRIRIE